MIIIIIVSITKVLIVIRSLRVCLPYNLAAVTWVSNACIQFELFVIGYVLLDGHVICMSIMYTLLASFAMFCTIFKTHEKHFRRFRSKEVLKRP